MKKIVLVAFAFVLSWYGVSTAQLRVDPYGPKDLTQIQDQNRSYSDGNPYNTWSYPGNIKPYADKEATGNPNRYLQQYQNRTSESGGYYQDRGPHQYNPYQFRW